MKSKEMASAARRSKIFFHLVQRVEIIERLCCAGLHLVALLRQLNILGEQVCSLQQGVGHWAIISKSFWLSGVLASPLTLLYLWFEKIFSKAGRIVARKLLFAALCVFRVFPFLSAEIHANTNFWIFWSLCAHIIFLFLDCGHDFENGSKHNAPVVHA